ncbi:MAG: UvrABC system protein C [Chitinophagales bacterium]|nr:MAG: UvrABC system protein C [Chitinophagales bacterium]
MTPEAFKKIQDTLPQEPGVYKFSDKYGRLIYVGKARNLRNRISSYFKSGHDNYKTHVLSRKTERIDFVVVQTEQDALLLENLLIKENQPRYNIQLRDDKTYPYICIKNERFPRIFLTRRPLADGSEYLGPYTSVKKVRSLLQLLQEIFPLRTCNLNLSSKNVEAGKFKVCLEYHIGNCLGPCENLQSEEAYNETIAHVRNVLKGRISPVLAELKKQMLHFAEKYEFEKAAQIKKKIELLENYQSRSTVVNPSIDNVDVFSIIDGEKQAYVNYLKVVQGGITQTKTIELHKKLDESQEEILLFAITLLREEFKSESREVIVPFPLQLPDSNLLVTVPQRGDKKRLLELSLSNAAYYQSSRPFAPQARRPEVLEIMQRDFRLPSVPLHIECFDNSGFQGSHQVAAVVVFKDGKPSKKDYRHYNIKTVTGQNDFASMEEAVYRRYKALQQEGASFPQLIIIDGGKGQLNAAIKALSTLGLEKKIPIISIAKKLEEIYVPDDPLPLHLDKRSPSLQLIQRIRNEAHRFAITFYQNKRDSSTLKTHLTAIPGIGEKTSSMLLKKFRSEKKIRQASFEELASLVGSARAQAIMNYYARSEVNTTTNHVQR